LDVETLVHTRGDLDNKAKRGGVSFVRQASTVQDEYTVVGRQYWGLHLFIRIYDALESHVQKVIEGVQMLSKGQWSFAVIARDSHD